MYGRMDKGKGGGGTTNMEEQLTRRKGRTGQTAQTRRERNVMQDNGISWSTMGPVPTIVFSLTVCPGERFTPGVCIYGNNMILTNSNGSDFTDAFPSYPANHIILPSLT